MKKIIALLLAALMLLTVMAGCKDKQEQTDAPGGTTTNPTEDPEIVGPVYEQGGGTLYLTADVSVLVTYDVEGTVQKVEPNEAALRLYDGWDDKVGLTCSELVSDFIKSVYALNQREMPYVVIKQNKGSGAPNQDFMSGLKAVAEKALKDIGSSAALVVLAVDKVNSNNHLDLASAKTLATAFLNAQNVEDFYGDNAPVNGYYSFYVRYDGMDEEVHVNALTGGVGQGIIENDAEGDAADATDPKEPSVTDPTQPSTPAQG